MADEPEDTVSADDGDGGDGPADANGAAPVLNYARPDTTNQGANLVTVATFGNAWEAHLALGKLEAAGIPAAIADENVIAATGGLYTNMVGGVKLRVPAAEVERALAALPKRVRAKLTKCPKCGSTETRQIEFEPGVKILFLLMLGIPYLFVERPWACLGCGNVWRAAPASSEADDEEDGDDDDDQDGPDDEEDEDREGPAAPPGGNPSRS
jgi:hypothetical protein